MARQRAVLLELERAQDRVSPRQGVGELALLPEVGVRRGDTCKARASTMAVSS